MPDVKKTINIQLIFLITSECYPGNFPWELLFSLTPEKSSETRNSIQKVHVGAPIIISW